MNPITKTILDRLELMWEAARHDSDEILADDDFDQDESMRAIVRMETIADVIDTVNNLAGGQPNDR